MNEEITNEQVAAMVAVSNLVRWVDQPRKHFDEAAMDELTESVRRFGVLQPLLVRRFEASDMDKCAGAPEFEVIAGERRLRAACAAGVDSVPVVIREISDEEALEMSLSENVQREDMLPLEEAEALDRLLKMGRPLEGLASLMGKSRQYVARRVSLVDLSDKARKAVDDGVISIDTGYALSRVAEEDRELALKQVLEPKYEVGVLSERKAIAMIDHDFLQPQKMRREYLLAVKKLRDEGCTDEALSFEEGRHLGSFSWYKISDSVPAWDLTRDVEPVPTAGELAVKYGAPVRLAPDVSGEKVGVIRVVSKQLLCDAEDVWATENGKDAERVLTSAKLDESGKTQAKVARERAEMKKAEKEEAVKELRAELIRMCQAGRKVDLEKTWEVLMELEDFDNEIFTLEDYFADANPDADETEAAAFVERFSPLGMVLAAKVVDAFFSGSAPERLAAFLELGGGGRQFECLVDGGAE